MAKNYISQMQLPGSAAIYYIKDKEGRDIICGTKLAKDTSYTAGSYVLAMDHADGEWGLYKVSADFTSTSQYADGQDKLTKTTVAEALKEIKESTIGGLSYLGVTTTELTDGSTQSTIYVEGKGEVTLGADDNGSIVSYTNAEGVQQQFIWNGSNWDLYGSAGTLGALARKDSVVVKYDKPLSITVDVNTYSAEKIGVKASADGVEVEADGTAAVLTGYNDPKSDEFVKSIEADVLRLGKVQITEAGAETSVSRVKGAAESNASHVEVKEDKLVASKVSVTAAAAKASVVSEVESKSVATLKEGTTNVASTELEELGENEDTDNAVVATVSYNANTELLAFGFKKIKSIAIQEADASVEIPTYEVSEVDVPSVSAQDVSIEQYTVSGSNAKVYDFEDVSVSGVGSQKSVASGSLVNTGDGASVMIGVSTLTKGRALTGLGDASIENVLTGVKVKTQPTITLETVAQGGDIELVKDIAADTQSVDASIDFEENVEAAVSYLPA